MTVFVGLDQHRAQITAEWLDTATGEVSRARVAPGDREGVRRFLSRFAGRELEVALEATYRRAIVAQPTFAVHPVQLEFGALRATDNGIALYELMVLSSLDAVHKKEALDEIERAFATP
jgi:hypothetical protein